MIPMAIPLAMMAVSGLLSGIGKYKAAKATAKQYEEEAKTADFNADMTAYNTAYNENVMRQMQRQNLAQIAGQQSENGLGGSGMALLSYGQSALNSEKDIMVERNKGLQEMFNFRRRAEAARQNARAARSAGRLGIFSDVLGTGASMASFAYGGK